MSFDCFCFSGVGFKSAGGAMDLCFSGRGFEGKNTPTLSVFR